MDTIVKNGDVYRLGDHRLMCGDSTMSDEVEYLTGGAVVDMVFTDPPYALVGNSTGVNGVSDSMMIRPFFRAVMANLKRSLKLMGHAYVCCDFYTAPAIHETTELITKNLIVWQKAEGGGLGSYYTKIYELIWLFANEPQMMITGKKTKTEKALKARMINGIPNIWKFPIVQPKDRLHPAQKPMELVKLAIRNSSDKGEIVLDLFGGSGTTLMAAEELGRRCYMMEFNPAFCQTIIRRWEEATGRRAEKIGG